jgi:hypothetical protein
MHVESVRTKGDRDYRDLLRQFRVVAGAPTKYVLAETSCLRATMRSTEQARLETMLRFCHAREVLCSGVLLVDGFLGRGGLVSWAPGYLSLT